MTDSTGFAAQTGNGRSGSNYRTGYNANEEFGDTVALYIPVGGPTAKFVSDCLSSDSEVLKGIACAVEDSERNQVRNSVAINGRVAERGLTRAEADAIAEEKAAESMQKLLEDPDALAALLKAAQEKQDA